MNTASATRSSAVHASRQHAARPTLRCVFVLLVLGFLLSASDAWSYAWRTGAYGQCSLSCGGGLPTRSVICVDDVGTPVAESFCAGQPKPATSQACNDQACVAEVPALAPLVRAGLVLVATGLGGVIRRRRRRRG